MEQRKFKLIDESGTEKTALQESNMKALAKLQEKGYKALVSELREYYSVSEKVLDFRREEFSLKSFREGAYKMCRHMKEANAELVFGQLLRAGVQNTFNDIYQKVPVTYMSLVRQTTSNKRQEFYAPLERAGFPKRTERGQPFAETSFKGLDIELINVKWGNILACERELIDDDQTGQIVQRASDLGENTAIFEEFYVYARMFNKTGTSLDGEPLPVSDTYSTPYSSSGIHPGGFGKNATSAARLSQTQIQNGLILAMNMRDQSGRPMLVVTDSLVVSPQDMFFGSVLLGSDYNPSTAVTTSGGVVGGIVSKNPIKNIAALVVSRGVPDYGALLVQSGKGFAFQRRDPTELVQENPQSGPAFSVEVFRYKNRSRWEADFIDPKFMINLNTSFASS